jgi:hypothetical protein
VVASLFESHAGDDSLGAHVDGWYGAVIHLAGVKVWQAGPGLLAPAGQDTSEVTTRAGDILLLPKGLPHAVPTPTPPGHSLHLAFALDRDSHPDGPPAPTRDGSPAGPPQTTRQEGALSR